MPQTPERMHPGGGRAGCRGDPRPGQPLLPAVNRQKGTGGTGAGGTGCPRPKASLFSPRSLHIYCEKGMQVLPGLTLLRFHTKLHSSARESQKRSKENAKRDIPSVRRTATSSRHFFTSENSTVFTDAQTNAATYTRPGGPRQGPPPASCAQPREARRVGKWPRGPQAWPERQLRHQTHSPHSFPSLAGASNMTRTISVSKTL